MSKPPLIYLDYAAATPVDSRVLKAMQPYFADRFYNPSATYGAAREVRQALTAARAQVAHWLGARPSEIIFTAGGTEANNLALHGVMRRFPKANVVVSPIEHESVLGPAHEYDCRETAVQPDGRLDLDDLLRQIDDHTALVSIGYANNEIGTVQSIRTIAQALGEIRQERARRGIKTPLYFHTDACQASNYLDLHIARLGVDLMTLNGGKIYGPKQSGALFIKAGSLLEPLISGGGQEQALRSGTENVPGIIGLATALDLAQAMRQEEGRRLGKLQQQFIEGLKRAVTVVTVNGSVKYRLPNNIHVTLPGQDNERLLVQLEQAGILAAAGSACSASREEPSHVLRVLGLSDDEARASLRFSMGRQTTAGMVEATIKALAELC